MVSLQCNFLFLRIIRGSRSWRYRRSAVRFQLVYPARGVQLDDGRCLELREADLRVLCRVSCGQLGGFLRAASCFHVCRGCRCVCRRCTGFRSLIFRFPPLSNQEEYECRNEKDADDDTDDDARDGTARQARGGGRRRNRGLDFVGVNRRRRIFSEITVRRAPGWLGAFLIVVQIDTDFIFLCIPLEPFARWIVHLRAGLAGGPLFDERGIRPVRPDKSPSRDRRQQE